MRNELTFVHDHNLQTRLLLIAFIDDYSSCEFSERTFSDSVNIKNKKVSKVTPTILQACVRLAASTTEVADTCSNHCGFFFGLYRFGPVLSLSSELASETLNLKRHLIGLFGRAVGFPQSIYLHSTTETQENADVTSCPEWDSSSRSHYLNG